MRCGTHLVFPAVVLSSRDGSGRAIRRSKEAVMRDRADLSRGDGFRQSWKMNSQGFASAIQAQLVLRSED